jgi:hypothetical protein
MERKRGQHLGFHLNGSAFIGPCVHTGGCETNPPVSRRAIWDFEVALPASSGATRLASVLRPETDYTNLWMQNSNFLYLLI